MSFMATCCHLGNIQSSKKFPPRPTTQRDDFANVSYMVARIGPKKPVRLYIAEWRQFRDLTQEALANRVGTTKGTVSRWEKGSRDILVGALAAIAEALQCDPQDLYRDPNKPSVDELLRDMNAGTRESALKIIRALKAG